VKRLYPAAIDLGLPAYYRNILFRQDAALAKMHLQWFAAEDEGRTEEPTEHKIRKAREEGKVAKSQEVSSAIVLLAALVTLAFFGPYYVRTLRGMMIFFLSRSGQAENLLEAGLFGAFLQYFFKLVLPLCAACFVAAIAGNVIQFGFLFSVKPITPDIGKALPNFSRFVQRAVLSTEALFNLAKSIFKVAVIGLIAYLNIRSEFGRILNMAHTPFLQAASAIAGIAFRIMLESAVFFLVLSFFDFLFQKHLHTESLKMTRQEVILERKDYEGDPLVRSRLRQRMRELLRQNIPRAVPRADVVITNPTHFAVALEYKREAMEAPTVTAKGHDDIARHIKRIARENGVPLIEDKPLARALYAEVEVGDVIPRRFYDAVAAVLKQVYALNGEEERKTG
jgi:flagellar biosynthetic protein FlhB